MGNTTRQWCIRNLVKQLFHSKASKGFIDKVRKRTFETVPAFWQTSSASRSTDRCRPATRSLNGTAFAKTSLTETETSITDGSASILCGGKEAIDWKLREQWPTGKAPLPHKSEHTEPISETNVQTSLEKWLEAVFYMRGAYIDKKNPTDLVFCYEDLKYENKIKVLQRLTTPERHKRLTHIRPFTQGAETTEWCKEIDEDSMIYRCL